MLVGAHYDHLGAWGGRYFPGADDNAASVAILVEVASRLARERAQGRGVIICAFDAEEPPHFATRTMGSQCFVDDPPVPVESIDMMVCLELVGHALGAPDMSDEVTTSLFALGAERSVGTTAVVNDLSRKTPGLIVRPADAEIIPPLSDYEAFWKRDVPFLLLTGGRTRRYHTPEDTPEHLDFARMGAVASFVESFVRTTCARDQEIAFVHAAQADATTLRSVIELTAALAARSPLAAQGKVHAELLLAQCDSEGRLPASLAHEPAHLIAAIENALA